MLLIQRTSNTIRSVLPTQSLSFLQATFIAIMPNSDFTPFDQDFLNFEILNKKISDWAVIYDFELQYAWQLLELQNLIFKDVKATRLEGSISPNAHIEGSLIHLGEGSTILPGAYIEGKVSIGKNCKIGPNCYIRGNTSIGDNCRIGQSVEIKNSWIGNHTNVGHLSYVGDSVLGHQVNFGAGTSIANLRHDKKEQKVKLNGQLIDTGMRKLGSMIGHGTKTGIHTSIYPATLVAQDTLTLPQGIIK